MSELRPFSSNLFSCSINQSYFHINFRLIPRSNRKPYQHCIARQLHRHTIPFWKICRRYLDSSSKELHHLRKKPNDDNLDPGIISLHHHLPVESCPVAADRWKWIRNCLIFFQGGTNPAVFEKALHLGWSSALASLSSCRWRGRPGVAMNNRGLECRTDWAKW